MQSFFSNLSTRAKLMLSFASIIVLLVAVTITAYLSISRITQTQQDLHDHEFEMALQLLQLRSHQNHNRAEMLDMMLTPDKAAQRTIEQAITLRSAAIDKILDELAASSKDPTSQRQVQELKRGIAAYRQTREQEIALIQAGNVEKARQLGHGFGGDQYEKIRALCIDMGDQANTRIDQQIAASHQAARSAVLQFAAIDLIALLLALGLVAMLNHTLANPLTRIAQLAAQVGGGDLTVNLPETQRQDEIGTLTRAFHQMMGTLRRSTADIAQAVSQLGSSASEILAATTQVASGTAETAAAINQTTTTVEEVRHAVQLSSTKAKHVSDNAPHMTQVSHSGQIAVEEASAGMERIRQQMETIAQTVLRLSEQGQSIGGIIAAVTDLADQSNLLSVNAAIEAAKAGEQGKGFAVVAQEIKSLAEQSKQATNQVRGILSEVQKATTNAMLATEQGSKAVQAGVKQAAQAGEAIQALAEASGEAVQAAVQIAASSQQQVVGMDQIGVAMVNINQAGAQNAASMKQMEVAARDLNQLGLKLKELVEQFKV